MEEYMEKKETKGKAKGGRGGKKIEVAEMKKEQKREETTEKVTKVAPKKVPKTRKPKDVDKQMYSGTRVINGHTFFVTIFDTVSKTQAFIKAYDPKTSQEYTHTVPVPGSLSSIIQIKNWAGGTLVEGIGFVPQRLSREAHLDYEQGRKQGLNVAVAATKKAPEKKAAVEKKAVVEKKTVGKPVVMQQQQQEEKKTEVEATAYEEDGFEEVESGAGGDNGEQADFEADFEDDFEDEGLDEDEAPTKLQGKLCQMKAKKRVSEIKEKKEIDQAATKLQGRVRVRKAKKKVGEVREGKAATKLQGRIRMRKAKKRVKKIKSDREMEKKGFEEEVVEDEDDGDYEDDDEYDDYEEEFESDSPAKASPKRPKTADSDGYGSDDFDEDEE